MNNANINKANQAGGLHLGKKSQQREGSDWEIRSALPPPFMLRKSGSGLTSAGLVNGMYLLKPESWRTKHSGGVILHHWLRKEAMAWQRPCWWAAGKAANQWPLLQPRVASGLSPL